jgi:predicted nucleotidyltransferase
MIKDKKIKEICQKVVATLKEKLKDNLVCVIFYGSGAREELKEDSDLDFYIFTKNPLPESRLKRNRFFARLAFDIECEYYVSLRGKCINELKEYKFLPLFADICMDGIVLYNKDKYIINDYLKKVKEELKERKFVRQYINGSWCWILKKEIT